MTSSCREILQGKAFQNDIALRGRNTWQEILPPCGRQNGMHLARGSLSSLRLRYIGMAMSAIFVSTVVSVGLS